MTLYPIVLGITRSAGNAQKSSQGPALRETVLTPELRQKVLARDSHTCRFCGFSAQKYQDVHTLNDRADDLRLDNLATACIFCQQCFALDKVGAMRSGVLIWLPEISQTSLHHIARGIYVARISQGSMADTAKTALESLMARREFAKSRLGTDDPAVLAMVMRDFLTDAHYAQREKKLDGIRLFPLDRRIIKEGDLEFNQFPQILAYWRSKDGPFGALPPHQWKTLYAQASKAA